MQRDWEKKGVGSGRQSKEAGGLISGLVPSLPVSGPSGPSFTSAMKVSAQLISKPLTLLAVYVIF